MGRLGFHRPQPERRLIEGGHALLVLGEEHHPLLRPEPGSRHDLYLAFFTFFFFAPDWMIMRVVPVSRNVAPECLIAALMSAATSPLSRSDETSMGTKRTLVPEPSS